MAARRESLGRIQTRSNDARPSLYNVLGRPDFRLLWAGEGVSMLGDQFYLIALPWLVLQITGNALSMGTVLAVAGVPRAVFMLLGGVLADRFSSRALMLASNLARLVLVAALAALTICGAIELWLLYAFAFAFGLASAFFSPAQNAIVPRLVRKEDLQVGNAIIQGTAQVTMFAGPALAGALIALLGQKGGHVAGKAVPDSLGIGLAFAIDAFTFLVSALTLHRMRVRTIDARAQRTTTGDVLAGLKEGVLHVWHDVPLRALFLVIAAVTFLVTGPFAVGIPAIADSRFSGGAAVFGTILSAYGGGMLIGTAMGAVLPRPTGRRFAWSLLLANGMLGVGMALLGLAPTVAAASTVSFGMGLAEGWVIVVFITWLQARTAPSILGRMMSLLMFAVVGLAPLSNALAGALVGVNASALFVGAGCLITLMVLLSAFSPAFAAVGSEKSHQGSSHDSLQQAA